MSALEARICIDLGRVFRYTGALLPLLSPWARVTI